MLVESETRHNFFIVLHYLHWQKSCRVSSRNFLHENRAKITHRFAYVSSKNCTKFRWFCSLMRKSYFAQIQKKILVFAYFAISCYFVISSYFVISLNFEKQFHEMMNKFRVNHTPDCSALTHAGQMNPNPQVLDHRTLPTITPFTGNQSQVVRCAILGGW